MQINMKKIKIIINLKKIKKEILKKMFNSPDQRKIITWRLGDVINNTENTLKNYRNVKFLKTLKTNFTKNKKQISLKIKVYLMIIQEEV